MDRPTVALTCTHQQVTRPSNGSRVVSAATTELADGGGVPKGPPFLLSTAQVAHFFAL